MSGTIDRRGATPPDFLVKLLTMVGDEAPDLISWTGGKLYIHDPVALERKMSVYFRHSNFSSFQRQLNNFGFRKVEGKGKLAPCMYMHDDLVGSAPGGDPDDPAEAGHQSRPRLIEVNLMPSRQRRQKAPAPSAETAAAVAIPSEDGVPAYRSAAPRPSPASTRDRSG